MLTITQRSIIAWHMYFPDEKPPLPDVPSKNLKVLYAQLNYVRTFRIFYEDFREICAPTQCSACWSRFPRFILRRAHLSERVQPVNGLTNTTIPEDPEYPFQS